MQNLQLSFEGLSLQNSYHELEASMRPQAASVAVKFEAALAIAQNLVI